ncbi:MAG: RagB/SusD family nutrient uptake outer membrane protein [Prevotellaceae bacterium]|nr:RagB/SusD family nutrient uptake outer membrane protein [Prevotellaceae bacterium]
MKQYKRLLLLLCTCATLASCSDILDTKSDMVEFVEDNTLSTPEDSLYSVMGIIRQMQTIADRTVLLGEVRADLMTPTSKATTAIKNMAQHDFSQENEYNKVSDYYAVINNCNYFLAKVDTTLQRLGKRVFEKEYAAVKTYRAWTYLQLAKVYGEVPLVTEPVLSETQAEQEMRKGRSDMQAICNYFIDDIKPYVDTELPQYGGMGNFASSTFFFIPVRVLLGELCLWAGRYQEAAMYLSQYITMKNAPVPTMAMAARWSVNNNLEFSTGSINGTAMTLGIKAGYVENICLIPMETTEFSGVKSMLSNVFNSTVNNEYYSQTTPSQAIRSISAAQNYVLENQVSGTEKDTVYAPKTQLPDTLMRGDTRLYSSFDMKHYNRDEMDRYSPEVQTIEKLPGSFVCIYRVQQVYLLFAEALNRAGYPETAFCILKYGLRDQNIQRYVDSREIAKAGSLIYFDDNVFTEDNTLGIHGRGCGDVRCDKQFRLPEPSEQLPTYDDTVLYRIPLVEDMIITEMALETAFEGCRFYDLMRVAKRRNDPSYLALPISKRDGEKDERVYQRLMDTKNWYLPLD